MTTDDTTLETQHFTSVDNTIEGTESDFDVKENQIPWFLGVLFFLIVMWAGISWIPLFGY